MIVIDFSFYCAVAVVEWLDVALLWVLELGDFGSSSRNLSRYSSYLLSCRCCFFTTIWLLSRKFEKFRCYWWLSSILKLCFTYFMKGELTSLTFKKWTRITKNLRLLSVKVGERMTKSKQILVGLAILSKNCTLLIGWQKMYIFLNYVDDHIFGCIPISINLKVHV